MNVWGLPGLLNRQTATHALYLAIALTVSCQPREAQEPLAELPPPSADGRLPDFALPLGYAITLTVDPTKNVFSGHASITVRIVKPTRSIVLHEAGLALERVEVRVGGRRVPTRYFQRQGAQPSHIERARDSPHQRFRRAPSSEIVIQRDELFAEGDLELVFDYKGEFDVSDDRGSAGLVKRTHRNQPYVFADFETQGARRAFPCFDDPSIRAPFDLTVVAPVGQTVAAVTPLVAAEALSGGWVRHRFARTPPLPPYLAGTVVGPFETFPLHGSNPALRALVPAGESAKVPLLLESTRTLLDGLTKYLAQPVGLSKLDVVAVPGIGLKDAIWGMEYPGLILINDDSLLRPTEGAFGPDRLTVLLTHELSHLWFGDRVGIPSWSEAWLKEGLAEYLVLATIPSAQPWYARWKHGLFLRDARFGAQAVRRNTVEGRDVYDDLTYAKAASLFRMTAAWIGDAAMRRGLQRYVREQQLRTASADDLFAALNRESGVNVAPMMHTFLNQGGVPVIDVQISCSSDPGARARVSLSQRRFMLYRRVPSDADEMERRWFLPVCFRYRAGGALVRRCVELRADARSVELSEPGCPTWFFPNSGDAGYYLFTLDAAELKKLAMNRAELSDAERHGLGWNLRALLKGREISAALADEIRKEFASEN